MSATERVRELLDERGVEWDADDEIMDDGSVSQVTYWYSNDIEWSADGRDEYLAFDAVQLITPEQAIAATLGQESDDAAMVKLHDQMNAAMLEYEMAQGIEKRDGDEAIVVPWVAKMHALLEEAATIGSSNCTNGERTDVPRLPHFWTHDGTLHVELPKLPESISVRLPDQRDREVGSARTWQFTLDRGTCHRIRVHEEIEDEMHCSECGRFLGFAGDIGAFPYNFCPNCGRKVVDA